MAALAPRSRVCLVSRGRTGMVIRTARRGIGPEENFHDLTRCGNSEPHSWAGLGLRISLLRTLETKEEQKEKLGSVAISTAAEINFSPSGSIRMTDPSQPMASSRRRYLGKYDLCARLGVGGQAEVYLALMHGQAGFNKLVVLKKLLTENDDPMRVRMFLDEARLAARLRHRNIVDTYEVGEDHGEYFIAMEYLEGQPMNKVARNPVARQNFTPAMWARVACEALSGLGHAHNLTDYNGTPLGVVHRDISPDNIFVTYNGEIKIVDFGIAKARLNSEKTETGVVKGKVRYMAPEQVQGKADHRADLFAMGVVLWVFLTRRHLFKGDDQTTILYRLMKDPIPALASVLPDVDPLLASIVDRAIQKDPDLRFQTAEEMREKLEEFIHSSGDLATDVQLGKVVREAFGEARQDVQRQVQAAVSQVAQPITDSGRMKPPSPQSPLPEITSKIPSEEFIEDLGSPIGAVKVPIPSQRRRLVILGSGVVGAILLGVTIAIIMGRSSGDQPVVVDPRPAKLAPVEITSNPPGARVELNGVELGRTPWRSELSPGPHTLIVKLDDYDAETLTVEAATTLTTHAIVLKPHARTMIPDEAPPKLEGAANDKDTPSSEVITAKEPPAAPVTPPSSMPQRGSMQRGPGQRVAPARRGHAVAPSPEIKKTAAGPASRPRVKAIEDDSKHKIKVIKD